MSKAAQVGKCRLHMDKEGGEQLSFLVDCERIEWKIYVGEVGQIVQDCEIHGDTLFCRV